MNIFITDTRPIVCAEHHCDVHLRKMIVETAQLLSTAHVELDGIQVAYKSTHKNHPSAVWVRSDYRNYRWAFTLLYFLTKEYQYRFDKPHKTAEYCKVLVPAPKNIGGLRQASGDIVPKEFVLAMPDEYKSESVETSYQNYLNDKFREWLSREKPMKVEWTKRDVPVWVSL